MAKTNLTLLFEQAIFYMTHKVGTFGCLEVTIGFGGNERVDYMTMDTKEIFRCYEIKISKSDFHSKCKNTFVGNFNYYVMPKKLYEEVKDEIPKEIGVYTDWIYNIKGEIDTAYLHLIKSSKKQELKVDKDILKNSMIRSLYREYEKYCDYLNDEIDKIKLINKESMLYE